MKSLLPFALVGVYVILLGIGTFLEKPAMRSLTALQINALVGIGVAVAGLAALFFHDPGVPRLGPAALGLGIGLMIGVGSIFYFLGLTKLPVSVAATIANGYIVITVVLSILVLHDSMTLPKALGIVLTIAGVTLLAYHG